MGGLFRDLSADPFSVPPQAAAFLRKVQKNMEESTRTEDDWQTFCWHKSEEESVFE